MNRIRATQIASKALQVRKQYLNVGAYVPICPYNLAESMGLDIRFVSIPSFEGMYLADERMILISAERPEGRKVFTCAHEIGHHVLGHGTVIDEIIEAGSDAEIEAEADFFASMLLMPSSAISRAASELSVDLSKLTSFEAYTLSKYMGVSFSALITHLYSNLKLIDYHLHIKLKSTNLSKIKKSLVPNLSSTSNDIYLVGSWWSGRALDLVIGDYIIVENQVIHEGNILSKVIVADNRNIFKAERSGLTTLTDDQGWSIFVRVGRQNFAGMYQYRHQEDDFE